MLMLDRQLDRVNNVGISLGDATTRQEERQAFDPEDLGALTGQFRSAVSEQTREHIIEVSQQLANKIQGARDALEFSADPVSQAATSLTEVIDRLLRKAFSNETVMAWTQANFPDNHHLIFDRRGTMLPTKEAQTLCFVYAGEPLKKRSAICEIAARTLVEARNSLEKLKHADLGVDIEKDKMLDLLAGIEGALVLSIQLSWMTGAGAALEQLRIRFTTAA